MPGGLQIGDNFTWQEYSAMWAAIDANTAHQNNTDNPHDTPLSGVLLPVEWDCTSESQGASSAVSTFSVHGYRAIFLLDVGSTLNTRETQDWYEKSWRFDWEAILEDVFRAGVARQPFQNAQFTPFMPMPKVYFLGNRGTAFDQDIVIATGSAYQPGTNPLWTFEKDSTTGILSITYQKDTALTDYPTCIWGGVLLMGTGMASTGKSYFPRGRQYQVSATWSAGDARWELGAAYVESTSFQVYVRLNGETDYRLLDPDDVTQSDPANGYFTLAGSVAGNETTTDILVDYDEYQTG